MTAALVVGLNSCDGIQKLTEAEAKQVVGVLSAATQGSVSSQSRNVTGDDLAKALSASFTKTQSDGGTALFTVSTSSDYASDDGLTDAQAYFNVKFTEFTVKVTDDAGTVTTYDLNGTMYMEYKLEFTFTSMDYSFLLYTGTTDTLAVKGGSIDTPLEISIINTLSLFGDGTTGSVDYKLTGICNGYTFTEETIQITASI